MSEEAPFVGRRKEIARILEELAAERNLVLSGRIGSGRTALLRQVAREQGAAWRFLFLDGSRTPAEIGRQLAERAFPERAAKLDPACLPWRTVRHALEEWPIRDDRRTVVVLDDIDARTHPRLQFLRWLRDMGRFRILAVTDRIPTPKELEQLRVALFPAPLLTLGHLPESATRQFFEAWAERYCTGWSQEAIHGLVLATKGYPLGMRRMAESQTPDAGAPDRPASPCEAHHAASR